MSHSLLPADEGAFAWRGLMLDVARHFLPIEELHRAVDAMALLRLNVLHLHLTDDQGWRFESHKWPRLTEVGAWRTETVVGRMARSTNYDLHPESYGNTYDGVPHGGFYTQDELRALVAHARDKGVTIVPEVDMPGHMRAARAAYPELGYDGKVLAVGRSWGVYPEVLRVDEAGLAFCQDILAEVCDVFDSPYVHIGGDECPKQEWAASAAARAQLEALGSTDMEQLQRWFTAQLAAFLAARGRHLLGWDEIVDGGLPAGEPAVMAWRDWTGAADRATALGAPVVQAPARLYLDYAQGPEADEPLSIGPGADLAAVYAFDPLAGVAPERHDLVLGLQGQLWREYIPTTEHLWYMAFPRAVALADVGWYGADRPPYEDFLAGLPARLDALTALGIGHHPL